MPSDRDIALAVGSLTIGLLLGGWIVVRLVGPRLAPREASSVGLVDQKVAPAQSTPSIAERLRPIQDVPLRVRSLPRLKIPRLGVDAPLDPVGLTPSGAMDIPRDGEVVAWYSLGPFPGGPGNAVLAGHVDWAKRKAVFSTLKDLRPGEPLWLEFDGGGSLPYGVLWVEQYRANAAPIERVFDNSLGSALTLITCGGVFDAQSRQYRDRIVVRALRA